MQGVYPSAMASSLEESVTLFLLFMDFTEEQSGRWNFLVLLLPIYVCSVLAEEAALFAVVLPVDAVAEEELLPVKAGPLLEPSL